MNAWRFRKCPACGAVVSGGSLKPLKYGRSNWRSRGYAMRRCPHCGYASQTWDFRVVEDLRRG